ncbi:hypothetical protein [Catenuloplanes japonicus]|uniref:hypothetical protein n=1 Tax=Catenuloplanes japonicus TaxID=33876 RepID=UPI000526F6F9|nr:hypothetical protein [Catenuloplanes japonicus]
MSRRVNRSWAAKNRRYRRAVLRQDDLITNHRHVPWFYADVDEFLRRGDSLADVRAAHRTEPIR